MDPWVAHYCDHGPTTRPSPYTSVVTATPHSKVGLGGGRDKPYFCYKYSNNILGVFRRACG